MMTARLLPSRQALNPTSGHDEPFGLVVMPPAVRVGRTKGSSAPSILHCRERAPAGWDTTARTAALPTCPKRERLMDRGYMAQIDLGGGTVKLRFDALEAEPGLGGHRLGVHYEATPSELPYGSTLLFTGQLRVQHGGLMWLGNLLVDRHLPVSPTAVYPHPLVMSTTINNEQLAWIEKIRAGGNVELAVDLRATLVGSPDLDYPANSTHDVVFIHAREWVAHAERLGALVAVPVLIPLPLGDPEGRTAQAGLHLQSALRAQADGRWKDAVAAARLSLEILAQIDPAATYDKKGDPRQRDLAQRFAVLRDALWAIASGAHHDDAVTGNFAYTPDDARAVTACAAALLQRRTVAVSS
jgi:hypothetical protein